MLINVQNVFRSIVNNYGVNNLIKVMSFLSVLKFSHSCRQADLKAESWKLDPAAPLRIRDLGVTRQ